MVEAAKGAPLDPQASQRISHLLLTLADVHGVLIKLADRLSAMRAAVPGSLELLRGAREALDVFAPMANRLGVWSIKAALEDLAFQVRYFSLPLLEEGAQDEAFEHEWCDGKLRPRWIRYGVCPTRRYQSAKGATIRAICLQEVYLSQFWQNSLQIIRLRRPGIEPGSAPWQGAILPLDHRRFYGYGPFLAHYISGRQSCELQAGHHQLSCAQALHPVQHSELQAKLKESQDRGTLEAALDTLSGALVERGLEGVDLSGRPKNLYGVMRKMRDKQYGLNEVYDVRALRVVVKSKADCYAVLQEVWHVI